MGTHTWHGALQSVSLHDDKGGLAWEGTLAPGRRVTGLPLDHKTVIGWLDARLLVADPEAEEAPDAEAATATTSRRKRAAATDAQEG